MRFKTAVLYLAFLALLASPAGAQIGPIVPPGGSGSGGGDALTSNPLSQFAATSCAQFAGVITSETGTCGAVVLSSGPRFGSTVTFGTASSNTGIIRMEHASHAFFNAFQQSATQAEDITYTLPTTNGGVSEFLQSNGSGVLTWAAGAGGITELTGGVTAGPGSGAQAATVVTNANLTGPITSVGNATTVADGELSSIAGLTSAQNKIPIWTGSGTAALFDGAVGNSCTDAVGTDAYACSSSTCPTALAINQTVTFTAGTANTAGATFAYCGLAAKDLVKTVGGISTALATGDILAKQPVHAVYNATDDNWKMISAVSTAAGGGITVGTTTITSGTDTRVPYNDGGVYGEDAGLTWADATDILTMLGGATVGSVTTAARATTTVLDTISGSSATSNWLNITGTLPGTLSAATNGVVFSFTGDNDGQAQTALKVNLSGASHSGASYAGYFDTTNVTSGNYSYGLYGTATDLTTAGNGVGVRGVGQAASAARSIGVWGDGNGNTSGTQSYGVLGYSGGSATSKVGGMFVLGSATDPATTNNAALIADNGAVAANIFEARDNGTAVLTVADGGTVSLVNGPLVIGSTGTAAGWRIGYEGTNSGYSAIWPSAATPSASNYVIRTNWSSTNNYGLNLNVGSSGTLALGRGNANVLSISGATGGGFSLASGTATSDLQAISSTQTWNNAGVTFTAIKSNITDTASNSASLLLDLQVGAASKFNVDKGGNTTAATVTITGSNLDRTLTAGGTTGAQTINKMAGSVNFAATNTTLVVTDSVATTTSLIFLTPQTADATCIAFSAVRASGSFTITANAACTAETAVAFWVTN